MREDEEGGKKASEWERLLGSLVLGKHGLSQQPINEQIGLGHLVIKAMNCK